MAKTSLPASFLPKKESPAAPVRVNIQDAPQKPESSRISNNIELEQIDLMNKIIYQEDNYQATNGGDLDDGYAYPRRRNMTPRYKITERETDFKEKNQKYGYTYTG
ncbi:hypothetical protein JTB14_025109 [Gonioctena quinquepunctata]|nr:hypothetical protein JTB14_025109 [Gonioctena quinquepunctata]